MKDTQEQAVLRHLKRHGEITTWDAITEYGVTRCAEIIRRLREKGYAIESERVSKKRGERTVAFVRYKLK